MPHWTLRSLHSWSSQSDTHCTLVRHCCSQLCNYHWHWSRCNSSLAMLIHCNLMCWWSRSHSSPVYQYPPIYNGMSCLHHMDLPKCMYHPSHSVRSRCYNVNMPSCCSYSTDSHTPSCAHNRSWSSVHSSTPLSSIPGHPLSCSPLTKSWSMQNPSVLNWSSVMYMPCYSVV